MSTRRTDAELTAAAAKLATPPSDLPPLPLWELLDVHADRADELSLSVLDVLDSIDHDLPADDPRRAAAIRAAGELAELYASTLDVLRRVAASIDHEVRPDRLLHDPTLKYPTPAQRADPRHAARYRRR